ncbi:MAG: flagellar basal-body rod protein FlgF [Phycisphaeraceae bacterium]|nr:MAG: flagellar basal-body rod protein FlgF [Phycisphaeraceae bacterium]
MSYGVQISTSGVLTALHRQDVLANNLANLNTAGYKPSIPDIRSRDAARQEDGLYHLPGDTLLERLGAGVVPAPTRIGFTQGPVETTGNDLDLAIEGDGFLAVRDGDTTSLTRDGRLALNARGQLVLAGSGNPVLGQGNSPITLPTDARIEFGSDGTVFADGEPFANLRFVDVPDKSALIKKGAGLFSLDSVPAAALRPAGGRIVQGAIEGSAVNEIDAMLQVQAAAKAVAGNIGVISYHDRMSERAINTFGRIA